MSRSNPSRADADRRAAALVGRGGRSAWSLLMLWWRGACLLSARLWRGAFLLLPRLWRMACLSSARLWRMACLWSARLWRMACLSSARLWRASAQTARLAIGIPDYDNYADHIRRHHPEREPMDRDAFFHERMLARYGKGRSRCC